MHILIGGRSKAKADAFIAQNGLAGVAEPFRVDITADVRAAFAASKPDIVIHTTGPFQAQGYRVAEAAIAAGCHYIDLADARTFVTGIGTLDASAKQSRVLVVSGASSVPCLTAAVVDHYLPDFRSLESIDYGISATQQTNRGLATTSAILSYVGKPFTTLSDGRMKTVHGWQGLRTHAYPGLGRRLLGNCDIPDLDLFPARYPSLKSVCFGAGHELGLLHLGLWAMSYLVRARLVSSLASLAPLLLKTSFLFDAFATGRSGFHMVLKGTGLDGAPCEKRFYLIAGSGHGPYIPCMPAIILAKSLTAGTLTARGARACLDVIDLETYLDALKHLDISIIRSDTATPKQNGRDTHPRS